MTTDEVLELIPKYPERITIKDLVKKLKLSYGTISKSISQLRKWNFIEWGKAIHNHRYIYVYWK